MDATVAREQARGGAVRMAPAEVEGAGGPAMAAEPFGARFALIKSEPQDGGGGVNGQDGGGRGASGQP
ncbi:hypothetical protein ACFWBX_00690 [Streptomyces sp. NPDC059991]|uniref:hypothetical protein n=1 Tax=Streptomyces sp. NPDC059991 TaxID=3347028 RepID=UPI0036CFEC08